MRHSIGVEFGRAVWAKAGPRLVAACGFWVVAVLGFASTQWAHALVITEGFDGEPVEGRLSCAGVGSLVVRRENGDAPARCGEGRAIRQWRVRPNSDVERNLATAPGSAVAIHEAWMQGERTMEILTSRTKQSSNPYGTLQADFFLDDDLPPVDEHYVLAHHLQLAEGPDCSPDCPGVENTATNVNSIDGKRKFRFYGVVAGVFGEKECDDGRPAGRAGAVRRCATSDREPPGMGYGLVGFAVEVPRRDGDPRGVNDLVDGSFLPVRTTAGYFPGRRWYRIQISRRVVGKRDVYGYDVFYRKPGARHWRHLGGRSFLAKRLWAVLDAPQGLPPGYIGLIGAFFEPSRQGPTPARIVWDNLRVRW